MGKKNTEESKVDETEQKKLGYAIERNFLKLRSIGDVIGNLDTYHCQDADLGPIGWTINDLCLETEGKVHELIDLVRQKQGEVLP